MNLGNQTAPKAYPSNRQGALLLGLFPVWMFLTSNYWYDGFPIPLYGGGWVLGMYVTAVLAMFACLFLVSTKLDESLLARTVPWSVSLLLLIMFAQTAVLFEWNIQFVTIERVVNLSSWAPLFVTVMALEKSMIRGFGRRSVIMGLIGLIATAIMATLQLTEVVRIFAHASMTVLVFFAAWVIVMAAKNHGTYQDDDPFHLSTEAKAMLAGYAIASGWYLFLMFNRDTLDEYVWTVAVSPLLGAAVTGIGMYRERRKELKTTTDEA